MPSNARSNIQDDPLANMPWYASSRYSPMRLFRLPYRVARAVRSAMMVRSQTGYVGWVGGQNLGDIALFEIISTLLSPAKLFPFMPTPWERRVIRILRSNRPFSKAICLGGGTLIGRNKYLNVIREAIYHNVPVFSFGTGVSDPLFWERDRGFDLSLQEWKEVLTNFCAISVRGELSAAILHDLGIPDVTVVGDPALGFARETMTYPDDNQILGVNCGHVLEGQFWGRTEDDTIELVSRELKILSSKGWRFKFFSVVPEDKPIHQQIANQIGNRFVENTRLYEDPHEFIVEAEKCAIFLGLKLHSVVLSYAAFTPAIMLAYQPKCEDFMHSVGRMDQCVRPDNITKGKIVDLVEHTYMRRDELRHDQFARCNDFKKRLKTFAKRVVLNLDLG